MSYNLVDSDTSGGGTETLNIYLYPNATIDDPLVQSGGVVRAGAESFATQLIDNDIIGSYYIYISYEHPGYSPNDDTTKTWRDWTSYDGPNDKESVTGCHLLVYRISTSTSNGTADGIPSGKGAFANSQSCVVAQSQQSSGAATKQVTVHEIGHTCIVDDESGVTDGLGDSDTSDTVDHELGQVYAGVLGDGPISPMSTGYADGEGREGDCSNNAPWNLTYDESLSSCAKEALTRTANQ